MVFLFNKINIYFIVVSEFHVVWKRVKIEVTRDNGMPYM